MRHVAGFARMIKDLSGDEQKLTAWTAAVDRDLPALGSFTVGLRRDIDAVTAGLTQPYSSGPVEGHREQDQGPQMQLCERANHNLLRKLVLLT